MKKSYETPEMTVYGSVENITQGSFDPRHGDEFFRFEDQGLSGGDNSSGGNCPACS